MQNDPLKKFIRDNREAFDDLEPSDLVLQRIKNRLEQKPAPQKGLYKSLVARRWFVAASISLLLMAGSAYFIRSNDQNGQVAKRPIAKVAEVSKEPDSNALSTEKTPIVEKALETEEQQLLAALPAKTKAKPKQVNTIDTQVAEKKAVFALLGNEHSATERLAGALAAREIKHKDRDMIDTLEKTMNNDPNSNVRLAALESIGRFYQEPYVAQKLARSLSTQDDPMVQIELINLLSRVDSIDIQDQLFALTNDPETLDAVKDEAYTVLISQNKSSKLFYQ